MAAVGKSKSLAEKFKSDSQKDGFNLQSFISENSEELEVAAREMHDGNEKAGGLFHDQIGGANVDFDKAISFNFKCPECGEIMHHQDNTRTIEFLKERIKELEAEQTKGIKGKKKATSKKKRYHFHSNGTLSLR